MLSTLENIRLREGDRVVVTLGFGEYEVEIVDAGDPAKLKILLDNGLTVWVGRKAVESVETDNE